MTRYEYESLQQQLSKLIEKAGLKYNRNKEREAYVDGILACKSVLHNIKEQQMEAIIK